MTKQELDVQYATLQAEHEELKQRQAQLEEHPRDFAGHEAHRKKLHEHIDKLHRFMSDVRNWRDALQDVPVENDRKSGDA